MKVRTQVQLDREEHEALRALARRRRVSMSQVARQAIRKEVGLDRPQEEDRVRRFLDAAGCGVEPDGRDDVARRHDAFLHGDEGGGEE